MAQAKNPLPEEVRQADGRGWRVFRCHSAAGGKCSCGNPDCDKDVGKHPITRLRCLDATSKLRHLQAWAAHFPCSIWGLATGEASGVVAIDDDETGPAFVGDLEQRQ
jgi:hypothetical protein